MDFQLDKILEPWGTLLISLLALATSIYTLIKNRNSISVEAGHDQSGEFLRLTNNSPHAVTVVDMGSIRGDGWFSSFLHGDSLIIRIDPRDVKYKYLKGDIGDFGPVRRFGRFGAYVQIATGQRYCSISTFNDTHGGLEAGSMVLEREL